MNIYTNIYMYMYVIKLTHDPIGIRVRRMTK
jgi:hypothetical protein